jgi:hypothetical protein
VPQDRSHDSAIDAALVTEVEGAFRVQLANVVVKSDRRRRIVGDVPEKTDNDFAVSLQLFCTMNEEESSCGSPCIKYARPVGLGAKWFPSQDLIFPNEREPAVELFGFVTMVVPWFHRSEELWEQDELVLDDLFPDTARNGIAEGLLMHRIDEDVDVWLFRKCLSKLPGFPQVWIQRRPGEVSEMGCQRKETWGKGSAG